MNEKPEVIVTYGENNSVGKEMLRRFLVQRGGICMSSDVVKFSRSKDAVISRFHEIMRRHLVSDDIHLSDDELVRAAMRRYEAARASYLIDPNE